jgi:hypothetical protein
MEDLILNGFVGETVWGDHQEVLIPSLKTSDRVETTPNVKISNPAAKAHIAFGLLPLETQGNFIVKFLKALEDCIKCCTFAKHDSRL